MGEGRPDGAFSWAELVCDDYDVGGSSSDTVVDVETTGDLSVPCYIVLDPEDSDNREVWYVDSAVTSTRFTISDTSQRYLDGSAKESGQTHTSGTEVWSVPVYQNVDDIWDTVETHAGRHENGGDDEISVAGLSGELADDQPPKSHGNSAHSATYIEADGSQAFTGEVQVANNVLSRPELKDYAETRTTPSDSGGTVTLDLENGNVFEVTLDGDHTFAFSNPPASGKAGSFTLILHQDGTGGREPSWPGAVEWAGGTAPSVSEDANATDVLAFVTTDAGSTWYGFVGGQDFS